MQAEVERLGTYTEVSPSGRGLKAIVRAEVAEGLQAATIEIYGAGRYFTITGRQLPGTPAHIATRQVELDALLGQYRSTQRPARMWEAISWPELEIARYYRHGSALLDDYGVPRRVKPGADTHLASPAR